MLGMPNLDGSSRRATKNLKMRGLSERDSSSYAAINPMRAILAIFAAYSSE